jgi:hypothetical protein
VKLLLTPITTFSVAVLLASTAGATPPANLANLHEIQGEPAHPPTYETFDLTVAQAKLNVSKIAAWDVTMQSTSCTDPEAGADASPTACEEGGIIEVETGPGMAIVASDNTQEAIGVWSINKMLNGKAYPANIADAFKYLSIHPGYLAWKVAGDPGPDYYSVYNCGWGVRAVILYEATTGDMSHHEYGVMCASHIATYASTLVFSNASLLNVGPAGWAASGLWLWGDTYDPSMKTTAASIGASVKAWIEASPSRLSYQYWAVTGAAPYYGVLESYMKENPTELAAWVTEYAPMLGGWIDESTPADPNDWTDWRNAWNGWNMLGQFTSAQVLGSKGAANEATAKDILTKLVAQENPATGAIPGSQQRPSTEAESWITAYMLYFGLLEVIDAASTPDGGTDSGAKDSGSLDAARDATPPSAEAGASTQSDGGCSIAGGGESLGPTGALLGLGLMAARRRSRSRRRKRSDPATQCDVR